ncbi:hypothetical protein RvY_17279 [Ramazzottius varieornatus]|uniref:Uncharacterized protein n=1 Tax=Ramazzottius varieornatus TaxID=947166 RepID=A0A1D1W2E9_RAMVA|nr:hypothetical protein RvY_17279 [Ramazzottius varieornatus]
MQLFWRKDFIRFMNQAITGGTTGSALTRLHVFGPILDQLYIPPAFLIVCYTPDVFEYEIRIQGKRLKSTFENMASHKAFTAGATSPQSEEFEILKEKPGEVLEKIMKTVSRGGACSAETSEKLSPLIWHMRLFAVVKPVDPPRGAESSSCRYLWGSEDKTVLCLAATSGLRIAKQSLEYSELMDYPMLERYYTNHNMLTPTVEVLSIRHRPGSTTTC